jgi:probable HAF family extracellular repeat protein
MRSTTFLAAAFLAYVSFCASAAAQSFMGLGDLPGGDFESFSGNLSADGRFVTGTSSSTTNGTEAFLWTKETGMVGLGIPLGSQDSFGTAVSNDGNTVVGLHGEPPPIFSTRALRWTNGGGPVDFDPFPVGAASRSAHGLSADGGTIVGGFQPGEFENDVAYHWSGGTLTEIDDSAQASAVSADGSVVVGTDLIIHDAPPATNEAFIWTAVDGLTRLGYLPGGSGASGATGVSADGRVVVGGSINSSGFYEAFRWTEGGGMVGLGDLPGGIFESLANDTTADGGTVVGSSIVGLTTTQFGVGPDYDPFIWDAGHGMRNLVDVLSNDYGLGPALAGWNLAEATAISDDGKVIVGNGFNPDGNFEAWIVRIPEPSTAMSMIVAAVALSLIPHRRNRRRLFSS